MSRSLLLLALLGCTSVMADSGVGSVNNATLQDSGTQYRGNFNVNQAAGDQQQQSNVRAIAIGTQAGAITSVRQKITTPANPSMDATATIGGSSFSNGNGVLGVNQSAGANNQMANAMSISISAAPQAIDDSALSQQNVALLPNSGVTGSPNGSRQAVTSDQAFTGSRGVIQVNQSAGVGNRMANTLSIRVAD
ncbi:MULTISPECIES: adhesin [unclassified Pseudomonas]|uniref:adhesin n=1 Tax=unclassified Pseudomonas TaxID=196821 RepID=UPI000C881340|nr:MULTISPECIES: adhesin [unclassified Pseudomonas]PMZ88339.1 adhesin [Pseudomonas sp. FW215-T2]PNA09942.1 adhesin [Pseudomonas sp. FW215-R3]PNB36129.1 adhesin [Pseudomonas sp. FW305-131]